MNGRDSFRKIGIGLTMSAFTNRVSATWQATTSAAERLTAPILEKTVSTGKYP